MSCKINLFVSRIIIVVFFSLSCAQTIMANCRMGNISVPLNHVFYMVESDGCWTCIQYCCPNGRWSYEECGYAPDINKFSIEELCEDNMCDKDSLYWAEKKACYTCENGIPEHGYAWGKREYDTENGYFLCDFKCDDGYEKVPRGTQSNGFMDWDEYCKLKEALACPEGYFESGGKCVKKTDSEKTLRDEWSGFDYIYTGGACGNDSHASEICRQNAMPGKGLKACSGSPSCKGTDGINYNCYANVNASSWEDCCNGGWQWCDKYGSDNACKLNCEYLFYTCE